MMRFVKSICRTGAWLAVMIVFFSAKALYAETKTKKLISGLGGDVTGKEAVVTHLHEGKLDDCEDSRDKPEAKFKVGDGGNSSAKNTLCGQLQKSEWNVKGSFSADPDGGITVFRQTNNAFEFGYIRSTAEITTAGEGAHSLSTTKFAIPDAGFKPNGVKIEAGAMKSESALPGQAGRLLAELMDRETYTRDNATVIDVQTRLFTEMGASASITEADGLLLQATAGQRAGYSADAFNFVDPTQSFSWSAVFDGTSLTVSGVDINDFMAVGGGYQIAYDKMPGHDLTVSLSGNYGYSAEVTAHVDAVPELSTVAGFGMGVVGFIGYVWRSRRKGE